VPSVLRLAAQVPDVPSVARVWDLPAWLFHGRLDATVSVAGSENCFSALGGESRGTSQLRLTVFEEARHDCWSVAYEDDELFPWVLQHRRSAI